MYLEIVGENQEHFRIGVTIHKVSQSGSLRVVCYVTDL
jgi:hypothetical protein